MTVYGMHLDISYWGLAFCGLAVCFHAWRNFIRRRTLKQADDGTFVWLDWNGDIESAPSDPRLPDGAWDASDCDGGDGGGGGD